MHNMRRILSTLLLMMFLISLGASTITARDAENPLADYRYATVNPVSLGDDDDDDVNLNGSSVVQLFLRLLSFMP